MEVIHTTYSGGPDFLLEALSPDVEWTEAAGFPYAWTFAVRLRS